MKYERGRLSKFHNNKHGSRRLIRLDFGGNLDLKNIKHGYKMLSQGFPTDPTPLTDPPLEFRYFEIT